MLSLQELTQAQHKLNEMQQQLQDSSNKSTQSEQQHQAVVMRLTQDLEQEQTARSDSPALDVHLLPGDLPWHKVCCLHLPCSYEHQVRFVDDCALIKLLISCELDAQPICWEAAGQLVSPSLPRENGLISCHQLQEQELPCQLHVKPHGLLDSHAEQHLGLVVTAFLFALADSKFKQAGVQQACLWQSSPLVHTHNGAESKAVLAYLACSLCSLKS